MTTSKLHRTAAGLFIAGVFCLVLAARPASAQSGEHLEAIHHPNYDTTISMPFVPAIKVKSGKLLWLSGGTALARLSRSPAPARSDLEIPAERS